jgi:hypothetical protein
VNPVGTKGEFRQTVASFPSSWRIWSQIVVHIMSKRTERIFWFVAVAALLAPLIALAWIQYQFYLLDQEQDARHQQRVEEARHEHARKAEVAKLRDWPLAPAPTKPFGQRPKTPNMSASMSTDEKLELIVRSHPDPEINTTLRELVMNEKVFFSPKGIIGNDEGFMTFTVVSRDDPALKEVQKADLPTFWISIPELSKELDQVDVLMWWVGLSHEYVHYQQWLVAPTAERKASFNARQGVGNCVHIWEDELPAYRESCRLLLQWDFREATAEMNQLCARVDSSDQEFGHALFLLFQAEGVNAGCYPEWARLAGHPHPEAF